MYEMGFVSRSRAVTVRTFVTSCGRILMSGSVALRRRGELAPSAQPQSVRARSATRTSVPRVIYETNYNRNIRIKRSTRDCQIQLDSDRRMSYVQCQVQCMFGRIYIAKLLFVYYCRRLIFTCHFMDLPMRKKKIVFVNCC